MPVWSSQGVNRGPNYGYVVTVGSICLILAGYNLVAYQVSTIPGATVSSSTATPEAGLIAMASRFALSPTSSPRNGDGYASVPCIAPYCEFKCQKRPENVTCEPPPREPIRVRTCTAQMNNEVVAQQIYPLSFGGFEEDVVECVPKKVHDFATIVPGNKSTYIFSHDHEDEYRRDYRSSRYSRTWRKGGWDCMRHYEILSAGSMPWYPDLEASPESAMNFLPKQLMLAARDMPGVTQGMIDHKVFDERAYYEKTCQLLEYTRRYLTVTAIASYVLETMGYPNVEASPSKPKVLLIQGDWIYPDYQADLLTIGMRKLLGNGAIDVPYRHFLYEYADDTPPNDLKKDTLYGPGFGYSHRLRNDSTIDRSNIEERIKAKEFDLVIYSCWGRPMPFLNVTLSVYSPQQVAIIDGEDWGGWSGVINRYMEFWGKTFFFMRELPDGCPFE